MPHSTPYLLNLDRSRTARAFDPGESLWTPELTRIFQLLHQQARALERRQGDAPLLAIAIFGGHGSGKTSLLHTLSDRVAHPDKIHQLPDSDDKDRLLSYFLPLKNRVDCLPLLKPNILAPHESFLYAFLAAAVEAEQKVVRQDGEHRRGSDQHYLSPVQQAFQDVSEYLQVIDETDGRQEYDPLGVSLERLERHTSDLRLKDAMRDLIDILADRLSSPSNSLVLMPVDDADLSQQSLVNTLDTFRRYLQHPRLVPIFTFTGRLSEELLTTHFSDKLRGRERSPRDGEDWRLFEKQIAHQYFARLFPVRNRIRLGATTVRVQRARYTMQASAPTKTESGLEPGLRGGDGPGAYYKGDVSKLLETASRLLFGHPESLVEPRVVLALRPGRLRRQLQILDVLNATKVAAAVEGRYRDLDAEASSARWAKIFERTAWSLLDVHRDVLSPLGLHVEELYGWPSHGLREWVLVRILDQKLDRRRTLLRRWRHGTEDRRGQVFSLLAANAFRPALTEEELVPGQEPYRDGSDGSAVGIAKGGLTVDKGLLWFLGLWLGFYLPQIVTREETGGPGEDRASAGVGWTLTDAPMLAMRAAKDLEEIAGTGVLMLEPDEVAKFQEYRPDPEDLEEILRLHLWCFHGVEQSKPWVALSFWRGLSLLGQLLKLLENYDGSEDRRSEAEAWVDKLLRRHIENGWISSSLRAQRLGSRSRDPTKGGESDGEKEGGKQAQAEGIAIDPDRIRKPRQVMARRLVNWMDEHRESLSTTIDPLSDSDRPDYRNDFLWRLHGDALLGDFWKALDRKFYVMPQDEKTHQNILAAWWQVLEEYLTGPRTKGNPEPGDGAGWVTAVRTLLESLEFRSLNTSWQLEPAQEPAEPERDPQTESEEEASASPEEEAEAEAEAPE